MMAELEKTLELYLVKKAPPLPENIKEMVVSFAPWINLFLIVVALPGILAVLGISAYVMPFSYWAGVRLGMLYNLSLLFSGVAIVLRGLALPGLFSKSEGAWRLLYYSMLISLVQSGLSYNLIGGLVGAVVGLYFWFQVKGSYK